MAPSPLHSGVCAVRVMVPPLVSSLTAARLGLWPYGLAIAALPLVSRPWTGLCWSHLLGPSSVCVCSWFYRASWLARGLPLLRPFALLLASCGEVPSGSLLRVPRQVFAMGSPFRVEPVSILDRNVDSTSTFLVLIGVFAMGSPCRVDFVSSLDRNEDSLRTFPCGYVASGHSLRTATGLGLAALVLGVTGLAGTVLGVTGRVLRTAPGCVVCVCIPLLVRKSG